MFNTYALFGYDSKNNEVYSGILRATDMTKAVQSSMLNARYGMPTLEELYDLCDKDCLSALKLYYENHQVVFEILEVPRTPTHPMSFV